jgi:hypothetical protein
LRVYIEVFGDWRGVHVNIESHRRRRGELFFFFPPKTKGPKRKAKKDT